jgi:hypothetical protein
MVMPLTCVNVGEAPAIDVGAMETKPKNFLLATDLTSRSAVALRRAARLAAEADGDLTVLSVIEHGLPPKIVTRRVAEARAESEADVAGLTQPAKERIRVQVIENMSAS